MTPNIGGIENFIMNYYRRMDKNRIQFDFVSLYDKIAFEDEIISLGGRIHHVTHFKKNPVRNYVQLDRLFKTHREYRIIHANMLSAAYIVPLIAAGQNGLPCIIAHIHNNGLPPAVLKKTMHRLNKPLVSKIATDFFACSEQAGAWMFGENPARRVQVIRNAIDAQRFRFSAAARNEVRDEFGLSGKFVVGNVARLSEQKNPFFLLDIFSCIHRKMPNSVLMFVGGGELLEAVKNHTKKMGLSQNVLFTGMRSDVERLLSAMDAFVMPSKYEGLGISALEAQASGLNCYVSDRFSREADVTPKLKFLNLSLPAESWAEEILSRRTDDVRIFPLEMIRAAGYDISTEAEKLENEYMRRISAGSSCAHPSSRSEYGTPPYEKRTPI